MVLYSPQLGLVAFLRLYETSLQSIQISRFSRFPIESQYVFWVKK